VPLFIDRLPFQHREVRSAGRRWRAWYALLPVILTDLELQEPPREAGCRPWKFDSGCAPDACAWRFHLEGGGLDLTDPDHLRPQPVAIRAANDTAEELPIRRASLWLVSNIPALRPHPHQLFPAPGVPYYDRSPRRTTGLYPLIGMRTFRRARLKVHLDFEAATISVWTPGAWHRGLSLFLRRLPGRFATVPFDQLCEEWR
jgi:hypothetical protein